MQSFPSTLTHRLFWYLKNNWPFRRITERFWPSVDMSLDGLSIKLFPGRNIADVIVWFKREFPERESQKALREVVSRLAPCLIIDVGANSGMYSLPIASFMHDQSLLVSVEPNPIMFEQLRENISRNEFGNKRIELMNCAVGGDDGSLTLSIVNADFGSSFVSTMTNRGRGSGVTKIDVKCVPLTKIIEEFGKDLPYVIMKIDIEGYEPEALMPVLLDGDSRKPDAILIEVAHNDIWSEDVISNLISFGYRKIFEGEGNVLFEK